MLISSFSFSQSPHQVRAVQRRVGLLASASDLSEEFKQELRGIRAALEQQRVCNAAVDAVVSEEVCILAAPLESYYGGV